MNEQGHVRADHYHEHFNPVVVHEAVGTLTVGLLALILLFAFLRQVKINRQLTLQLAKNA